jgi:hypothetical protein
MITADLEWDPYMNGRFKFKHQFKYVTLQGYYSVD